MRIDMESLSSTCRRKLKKREFSRVEVEQLYYQLKEKYHQRKKEFYRISCWLVSISLLLIIFIIIGLGFGHLRELLFICLSIVIIVAVMLMYNCYIPMLWVPMQYARCLKKGYPELVSKYGFAALKQKEIKKAIVTTKKNSKRGFALNVEDTFDLEDSNNLAVVGYAIGPIYVGTDVYYAEPDKTEIRNDKARVIGIEIGGITATEASYCNVTLHIENGRRIKQGMVLYTREYY